MKNTGQIEQYYVKDSHQGIISEDDWEAVQLEFERRERYKKEHHLKHYGYGNDVSPFCSKVICGYCGHIYGRKSWINRGIHYWQCNKRFKGKGLIGCKGENIQEAVLHRAFVIAWNAVVLEKDKLKKSSEGNELDRLRARQMEELVEQGKIEEAIPELVQLVLEKVVVQNEGEFVFCFLDGTSMQVSFRG